MINIILNAKSQGLTRKEKVKLFSQVTYSSQNLGNKSLLTADHKYIKVSKLVVLAVKLWLKEDNILFENNHSNE